jgi:hypothetical protein
MGASVCAARAALNLTGEVAYWRPVTAVDYAAVALTSALLILVAAALVTLIRPGQPEVARHPVAGRVWPWSLRVAAGGAAAAGIANFIEDWMRVPSLGYVFATGMPLAAAGALAGAASRLLASGIGRWRYGLPLTLVLGALILSGLGLWIGALGLVSLSVAAAGDRPRRPGSRVLGPGTSPGPA